MVTSSKQIQPKNCLQKWSFWPFGPSFPFILFFWAFIFFHFGLLGLHFNLLGLDFELLGLGPGFCPGALLACGGSIPSGSLSLGAPRTRKVGIYGPALNPKRWKFGWLACRAAEWGEKKRSWPSSWDNLSKGYTLRPSTTIVCRHPHTLQVCRWRHPSMRLTACPQWRRPKP